MFMNNSYNIYNNPIIPIENQRVLCYCYPVQQKPEKQKCFKLKKIEHTNREESAYQKQIGK